MAQKNQEGNQYKKGHYKYPTPEERKKIFKALIEHLASGLSLYSFPYMDDATIATYCEKFPMDFPSSDLQAAKRLGRKYWELVERDGISGRIANFNAKQLQFKMMNSYGMSIKQNSNVNLTDKRNVKEMSEDELNEVVDG